MIPFPFYYTYQIAEDAFHSGLSIGIIPGNRPVYISPDFCFHFDNWPRLLGDCKYTSVRIRDTQEHESEHANYW
ncbi:hypothetical protein TNCV_3725931 [Trichonephila clavipes]|nr:hypothetical protein TNCV_3725931 [Trichonephila clavipes]